MSSISDALVTWFKTNTSLTNAPVWIDNLGPGVTEYSINPGPGARILESYINGSSLRAYPFTFNAMVNTNTDAERLANIGFFETLADWMEGQTETGSLPTLASGQTAESVTADSWGYLWEKGESGTGVYQVQCTFIYTQAPYTPEDPIDPEEPVDPEEPPA